MEPAISAASDTATVECRSHSYLYQPRLEGSLPATPGVEGHRTSGNRSRRRRDRRNLWRAHCEAECRGGHRSHLLSAGERAAACRGPARTCRAFLHCGTIWVHGPSVEVPTTEAAPRTAFGDYGQRKAAIEAYLLSQASDSGNDPASWASCRAWLGPGQSRRQLQPGDLLEVAAGQADPASRTLGWKRYITCTQTMWRNALSKRWIERSAALGESFHVVSPAALTLRGYAECVSAWFGKAAQLQFLPWEEWRTGSHGEGCRSDLGPHRPLAKLQHRQSTHHVGI